MRAALGVERSTRHTFDADMRCERCRVHFDERGPTCDGPAPIPLAPRAAPWSRARVLTGDTFGARLRSARVERELTQAALGYLVGVSDSVIAKWEAGRRQPRATSREALERVLALWPATPS